jgi:hypothetical protein
MGTRRIAMVVIVVAGRSRGSGPLDRRVAVRGHFSEVMMAER